MASRAAFKPANQKAALARTGQWQGAAAGNLNAAWGGRGQWQRAAAAERLAASPAEVRGSGPARVWGGGDAGPVLPFWKEPCYAYNSAGASLWSLPRLAVCTGADRAGVSQRGLSLRRGYG